MPTERYDAVVVGAGPAGSLAALVLARAGKSVCLLERGPYPGAKNLYGGVVYGRVLDAIIPEWTDEAPIERWVTRRVTMVLTKTQSLAVDFRSAAWGAPPYNGATALRPAFDSWLAGRAEREGATLVTSTTATKLLRDPAGRVGGVSTDRPEGDIESRIVIACDGVNSFIAREAGLAPPLESAQCTLGVKEVRALPAGEIERRLALAPGEGADFEILGGTGGVAGGGFLYTNAESLSVGVVLVLDDLARSGRRPEELLAELSGHPAIAPLLAGSELVEYGAHLIPEAGLAMMPKLAGDGILVAGDAAGMCLAAGLFLEGVNFAMASGALAGRAAAEALERSDTSASGLSGYAKLLQSSFVLADHRKLRRAPDLVMSERMQRRYPALLCNLAEELFTVRNPEPKRGLFELARPARKRAGLRRRDLARDAWDIWRTFG